MRQIKKRPLPKGILKDEVSSKEIANIAAQYEKMKRYNKAIAKARQTTWDEITLQLKLIKTAQTEVLYTDEQDSQLDTDVTTAHLATVTKSIAALKNKK